MKDGTEEFRSKTAGINGPLNEKIDDIIAEKTGSDVELSSFVDPRNADVEHVQFMITMPTVRVSNLQREECIGLPDKIHSLFRQNSN